MITLENVNKFYHKGKKNQIHVIDNTSLNLPDNGLVALLGNSGSGKTTLLNVIGGLDKVKKGNIYINGKKITSRCNYKVDKIRNVSIGYIFQDYKLINDLSVFDNVAIVLKMIGLKDKTDIKTRVEFILDKVGMLRYKKRPASMLSGGERQRVAIARAIVKDPDVILADEPTGNLDSKNSIEIMNIIKAISKTKLVILVTHEQELAHFYADRIINVQDGKIIEDIANDNANNLNYQIDNRFYLKDFEHIEKLGTGNVYSDKKEKLNLDIVFKNGNIYIRNNGDEKIEVVDEESNIEFIDDNYKGMNKKDIDDYDFTYSVETKKKYSSICNIFTSIKQAFNKIIDYTTLKKLLLVGFVISGCFIMYAMSTMFAALEIKDENFIQYNRNYLYVNMKKLKINDMLEYEKMEDIGYVLPSDSLVGFDYYANNFYQTSTSSITFTGSLSSIDLITKDDLIYGTMPTNDHEIVIDKLVVKRNMDNDSTALMVGIKSAKELVGKELFIGKVKYTVTGITDLVSPSIYTYDNQFINIMYNYKNGLDNFSSLIDYNLVTDIDIKEGRAPIYDYETIINISEKENYKIGKQTNDVVNDHKLTVVGYYYSYNNEQNHLVNNNTIKYDFMKHTRDFVIYSKNPEKTIENFRALNINIEDSYKTAKENYKTEQAEETKTTVIISYIIIGISLIEMFLMMRSSFLSRIKEIGIYRAIGVKKFDIYKMFMGEIIVITTLTSVPGILFTSYLISILKQIKYLGNLFMLNIGVILVAIILVYAFNLLVGLIPVANVLKKKPAIILSRHDLD